MIAIIDYGAGNSASVANALEDLGFEYVVSKNELQISSANKIILPGVGEASSAIRKLSMLNILNYLRITKKPVLGICLGMQLMCEYSLEGNVAALGVLPGQTNIFDNSKIKVPHMGWSDIEVVKESKLFSGIANTEAFYFAHSYYMPVNEFTTSKSVYDIEFSTSMEKNNYFGVQFHPEKSGVAGLKLLKNFIENC